MKKLKGTPQESLLKRSFLLSVCRGDTISPRLLQVQVCELESEVCELEAELPSAMKELTLTQDAVTHAKEQLQKLVVQRDKIIIDSGKMVEEMSKQHRKRKLFRFRSAAESLLWLAESFELMPESVNICTIDQCASVTRSSNNYQVLLRAKRWTSMLHYRPSTFLPDLESRINYHELSGNFF